MTALLFFAACLACFRLSRLFADDKIFDWLRSLAIRKAPEGKIKTKVKQGIKCAFCWGFYFAALIAGFLVFAGVVSGPWSPLWGAAIWGGSVLLNQLFVRLSK